MSKTMDQARADLMAALPHFRYAVAEAQKNGQVMLGILCERSDGSRKLEMSFDCAEFFDDLALVLGAAPQSAQDDLQASATQFAHQHNIRSQ